MSIYGGASSILSNKLKNIEAERPALRSHARTFACAMNARQPPKAEMSRAPWVASGSTRKPFTVRPSASARVPMASGGGTANEGTDLARF